MNWSNVKLILWREIRDQLRDRRTLFMIAVLPILLYPLLGMSFLQISQFMREHATKVLVIGAPRIAAVEVNAKDDSAQAQGDESPPWPTLIDHDHFDSKLFINGDNTRLLDLLFGEDRPGGMVDWEKAPEAKRHTEAQKMMNEGDVQVVVYFPPDFARRLEDFRRMLVSKDQPHEVQLKEIPSPTIYYNTASEKSQITYNRVSKVLERWAVEVGRQNLVESKVPILAAKPFDFETQDVAAVGHRDAALWSKILPFVLLIWALTGAFYPAIDLCAGEKERGTLETLLSSPAERSEIVWGKLLTVMVFSMTTAILNLLCMGVTSGFVVSQLNRMNVLGATNPISTPPVSALLWLVIALVPVSALFSALCLALASFARSTKEGQYYLMPLMLITMPLMMLPMAPGVELTLGNSLIPISGVVLLLRSMLEGNYAQALPFIPPVTIVTLVCCLFAIRWAVDQFNKESVLFRESERLDLGLWVRHLVRDRGPTPTVAGALSCFMLIMMIQFVMNLSLPAPEVGNFRAIAELIFISQVVVIGLPALMMTLFFTRSPKRTLLLSKPRMLSLPLAVILAVTIHPIAQSLSHIAQKLYPLGPEVEAMNSLMQTLLTDAPYAWLPFVLIALLPAFCEELAFRGFILSGLRHLGHKWWAIGLTAMFFGVVHGVLQQSLVATVMGMVIGYIAVQTGSLWPCICYHFTHNSLGLLSAKLMSISPETHANHPELSLLLEQVTTDGTTHYMFAWPAIIVGAIGSAYILSWFHRLPYHKSQEEKLQEALDHQSIHFQAG